METYKYLLSILVLAMACSCENVLDEVPVDRLTSNTFFKSEEDAVSSVNSLYSSLKSTYDMNYIAEINYKSDYMDSRGSRTVSGSFQTNSITQTRQGDIWRDFYRIIGIANNAIENIPDIVENETMRNKLLGECHFFRAFSHYNIARLFGPAPIRTEAVSDLSKIPAPRASIDEVFDQVFRDLELAEQMLPITNTFGRANKATAQMTLASSYLWSGNYALAMDNAMKVIESGNYQIEVDNYSDIFHPDELSEEVIFFLRHFREAPGNSSILNWFHAQNWLEFPGTGTYVFLGNRNTFIMDWDEEDNRKSWNIYDNTTPFQTQLGETIYVDTPFIHFGKFRDPKALSNSQVSYHYPIYRLAEAYLIFIEADIRLDGTLSTEARNLWNIIRRRAYGRDINTEAPDIDITEALSTPELLDEIFLESGKELMSESKRWFDMLRFDKVEELVIQAGYPYESRVELFPIPLSEINTNDALSEADQNPGY